MCMSDAAMRMYAHVCASLTSLKSSPRYNVIFTCACMRIADVPQIVAALHAGNNITAVGLTSLHL